MGPPPRCGSMASVMQPQLSADARIKTLEREVRTLRTAAEVKEKVIQETKVELKVVKGMYENLLERFGNAGVDRSRGTAGNTGNQPDTPDDNGTSSGAQGSPPHWPRHRRRG
jgi:hypothetical protein